MGEYWKIPAAAHTNADFMRRAYEGGGFPITKEGRLKFGFRARKFTNFQDHPKQDSL